MSKVKILLLRRWYMVGGAALLAAAAIFYAVNYPASVSAAATTRQLPIYSVERSQKVCAISFDAAWGDAKVRSLTFERLLHYKTRSVHPYTPASRACSAHNLSSGMWSNRK